MVLFFILENRISEDGKTPWWERNLLSLFFGFVLKNRARKKHVALLRIHADDDIIRTLILVLAMNRYAGGVLRHLPVRGESATKIVFCHGSAYRRRHHCTVIWP